MKKLFFILVVFCLVFSFSGFALAQDDDYPSLNADVYFHALLVHQENFRPAGGIFGDSMGAGTGNFNSEIDNDFDQMIESRFRFFMNAEMSKQITGRFTLEVNPEYGRERGFGDFRVNSGASGTGELRFKHFYIEVRHPVAGTLGYRVGRQGFSTPRSLIVGDPDAEGLTLWFDNVKAGKFTAAVAAADTNDTREIEDIYSHFRYDAPNFNPFISFSLYFSSLVIRDLTPGAFNAPPEINAGGYSGIGQFILGPSNTEFASGSHASLYWVGFQGRKVSGAFNLDIDAVASFGNVEPGENPDPAVVMNWENKLRRIQGFLGMIDASYGKAFYRFGLAGAYVSGHDPDPDTDIYNGYVDINAGFSFTRFFFAGSPYLVAGGFPSPSVQGSGLIATKIYCHTNPTYWLSINAQAAALNAASDRPRYERVYSELNPPVPDVLKEDVTYRSYATDAGRYYGTELNLWAVFSPINHVEWLLEFDYFLPGSYFKGTYEDETTPGNGFLDSPDPAYRIATGFIFK